MNTHIRLTLTTMIIVTALVVGCSQQPTREPEVVQVTYDTGEEIAEAAVATPAAAPAVTPAPTASPAATPIPPSPHTSVLHSRPNRLIVKNAELKLLVTDTDVAIDLTTQVAADCAGYIISSRVWYEGWQGESYKYATITLGVPVDQFERAMRRLRGLALHVLDESAAGQAFADGSALQQSLSD